MADPDLPPSHRRRVTITRDCCEFHKRSNFVKAPIILHLLFFYARWIKDRDVDIFTRYVSLGLLAHCILAIFGFIFYRLVVYFNTVANNDPVPHLEFIGYAPVDRPLSKYMARFLCPFVCRRHLAWTFFLNAILVSLLYMTHSIWVPWILPLLIGDRYKSAGRVDETLFFMLGQIAFTVLWVQMYMVPQASQEEIREIEAKLAERRRQEAEAKREEQERKRREERQRKEAEERKKGWQKPQKPKKTKKGF